MNLTYTDRETAFRAEARAWLEANVPKETLKSFDTAEGAQQHRAWEKRLDAAGWAMVPWPKEYGGRGANLLEWLVFEEEYYRARAPKRINQNGVFLLGPTIMEYGTPEQKARFLPKIASSEEVWAQGWSEPNAGSDMAAITTTARRDGDHYVIKGQKTWASRGAFADWLFGMFRTDPSSERHNGLTFILVPLDTPGVTVRPIAQLDGETGFAEVFFDDARVPVANTLGKEGQGWSVAMSTAGFERGLMLRSPARFQDTAARLVALLRENALNVEDAVRDEVVRCWIARRGLHARDLPHRLAPARRRQDRRRVEPQQDLLERARHPHARARARNPRRALGPLARGPGRAERRRLARRVPLLALGPDLRRHQRDPAQHHRRAHPRDAEVAMDFRFTDDQLLLQTTVRDFLAKEHTPEALRKLWETETGRSRALWKQLAEIGVPGLLVPEAHGGMGLSEVEGVLIHEEAGRAALAEPLIATMAVGRAAAARGSAATLAASWLPRIAAGEALVAVGHPSLALVEDAHVADLLLLPRSDALYAVPRDAARLTLQPANDPSRRLASVAFEERRARLVARGERARALLDAALDRGALATAAQASAHAIA